MATVQSGNGQDVHEGKDDAQESRHPPEDIPVPISREEVTNGTKAAQRLGTLGSEDVFQVINIGTQHMTAILYTGGEALKEAILLGEGLVER